MCSGPSMPPPQAYQPPPGPSAAEIAAAQAAAATTAAQERERQANLAGQTGTNLLTGGLGASTPTGQKATQLGSTR